MLNATLSGLLAISPSSDTWSSARHSSAKRQPSPVAGANITR